VHLSELQNAIRFSPPPSAHAVNAEKRSHSLGCLCSALPVAALIQLAAKSTAMPLDHRQSWNLTNIGLTYETEIPTSFGPLYLVKNVIITVTQMYIFYMQIRTLGVHKNNKFDKF